MSRLRARILAVVTLLLSIVGAFGVLVYAGLRFGDKGFAGGHEVTEMYINRPGDDPEAGKLTLEGDPGGVALLQNTYFVSGENTPLELTTAYRMVAEGANIALFSVIVILLFIGSILLLANKNIRGFARVGALVTGLLSIVVSVLHPFFDRESDQATIRELGLQAETETMTLVAHSFSWQDINFILMGVGVMLTVAALALGAKREVVEYDLSMPRR